MLRGNCDLVRVPEDVTVLDFQHLSEAATGLQRADDSIAHRGASEGVGLDLDAKSVERRRGEDRRRAATAPIDRVSQDGERPVEGLRRPGRGSVLRFAVEPEHSPLIPCRLTSGSAHIIVSVSFHY